VTPEQEAEIALREADRLAVEASHAKQLGFRHLAAELRRSVDAARKWALDRLAGRA